MTVKKYDNKFFDSSVWNSFESRQDDIVIASYAKSGTTLVQQIIAQLIFKGIDNRNIAETSPWLDSVYPAKETKFEVLQAQMHRRFFKSHLPANYLPLDTLGKCVYIARDGRDVAWSLYRHQCAISNNAQSSLDNSVTGNTKLRVIEPPSESEVDYFATWLAKNGHPFWPYWENIQSWWAVRSQPNVLLLHFQNLIDNLPESIQKIATFLQIEIDSAHWENILKHCSFDHMKLNAPQYVPFGVSLWKDEGKAFFNRGKSGDWLETLPADLSNRYEQTAVAELGQGCANWLALGRG